MSKRFELIHVTYHPSEAPSFCVSSVHFVRIDNNCLDDDNSEFIAEDIIMDHSDVLAMFSEEFRWKMKKMNWSEWETYRESLR